MRRALSLLPLLSLATAGCERFPEDPIFAYGEVRRVDGAPVAGHTLTFDRGANPQQLGPNGAVYPLPEFAPFATATTLPDGSFTLELILADTSRTTQSGEEYRDYRFRTATPLDEQGQAVIGSFNIRSGDVELPPLKPWATELRVTPGAGSTTLSFAPPPPAPQIPLSGRGSTIFGPDGEVLETRDFSVPEPVVQVHGADGLVWQQPEARSPWTLSEYALEDFAAEAQVRAVSVGDWYFSPLGGDSSNVDFRLEWRGGRVALPAGTRRPVSRGAACSPPRDGVCPWTDGKLAPVELTQAVFDPGPFPDPTKPPPGPPPEQILDVGLSLPADTAVSRLVVRGLVSGPSYPRTQQVVLEGSTDGFTWSPLARVPMPGHETAEQNYFHAHFLRGAWAADSVYDAPLLLEDGPVFLDLPLPRPTTVRHVRLSVVRPDGSRVGLVAFSELSVFE